ncbi:hypothetical protein NQ317_005921 [Molorchus minor]|uniref:Homeobox domain-containing protein n=1 Tax=Molorchus minor TaxID=1323400 RepID=A0ABQ9JGG8_9CUCU|nr:hypothetical protein NQ317_005921 [Molorchus minor]
MFLPPNPFPNFNSSFHHVDIGTPIFIMSDYYGHHSHIGRAIFRCCDVSKWDEICNCITFTYLCVMKCDCIDFNPYLAGSRIGRTRTKDKYRIVYTDHQRVELEKEFYYNRYITIRRKAELASALGLSERQVKIWFQNRRAKERKQVKKKDETNEKIAMDMSLHAIPQQHAEEVKSQVHDTTGRGPTLGNPGIDVPCFDMRLETSERGRLVVLNFCGCVRTIP